MPDTALVGQESSLIVLARVIRAHGDPAYPDAYDLEVRRSIKGAAPAALAVPALKVTLCDDKLGVRPNQIIVLAFDVAFRGQTINPHWELDGRNAVVNGSGSYEHGMSLDQLIKALNIPSGNGGAVSPAPQPSEGPSAPSGSSAGIAPATLMALALLLAVLAVVTRVLTSRRKPR